MARYDTYGATDDQILEDLDSAFKGFNNRSRPDILQSGMFSEANNVRFKLNGTAQKRKGISVVSAPFTVDTNTALVLPFNTFLRRLLSSVLILKLGSFLYLSRL